MSIASVAVTSIDFTKAVGDVARQLDILAFDLAPVDPETSDTLRVLYQQLEDAMDVFSFGRSLRPEPLLITVPDRPLDEDGQR